MGSRELPLEHQSNNCHRQDPLMMLKLMMKKLEVQAESGFFQPQRIATKILHNQKEKNSNFIGESSGKYQINQMSS